MNKPTESELEILQLLWLSEPRSVREINDALNQKREVGYTTTLKIMQIMFEKGLVNRDTTQRSHLYTAIIKEDETKNGLLNDFVSATFKGSMKDMVLSALGNSKTSQEDLAEIKKLIADLQNKEL